MRSIYFSSYLRGMALAGGLGGLAIAVGTMADAAPAASGSPQGPIKPGSKRYGGFTVALHRGAVVVPEATVLATPKSCRGGLDLTIEWDEAKDRVWLRLQGKHALDPYPSVFRSKVTYRANVHSPEPQHIDGGEYRLWISGVAGPMEYFHYDKVTGKLVGWPGKAPPKGVATTALEFPTLITFPTPPFQPKNPSGKVDVSWSFSFEQPSFGEFSEFSYSLIAYIPPNLCDYNQFRPDLSGYRQFVLGPYTRKHARPFSEYLDGGLKLEVTVHPIIPNRPPNKTLVTTYSNTTIIAGTVPPSWVADFDAELAGAGPPIKPWVGAKRCEDVFAGFHAPKRNFCKKPKS